MILTGELDANADAIPSLNTSTYVCTVCVPVLACLYAACPNYLYVRVSVHSEKQASPAHTREKTKNYGIQIPVLLAAS